MVDRNMPQNRWKMLVNLWIIIHGRMDEWMGGWVDGMIEQRDLDYRSYCELGVTKIRKFRLEHRKTLERIAENFV